MQETSSLNEALLAFVENFSERGTAFMVNGEIEFAKRNGLIVENVRGTYDLTEVGLKIKASKARCDAAPQRVQSGEVIGTGRALDMLQDVVNHPPHYKQGGIECIDAIRAALTTEEYRGYCKGNALKYIWRERHKGGAESLAKAGWYINRLGDAG